ncbi:TPA: hypothetical protein OH201_002034 [Staphylococcus aureus]|nr:hypothetical protein [Staphylococcus aureus]HCQ3493659.1 hypothetical protein [Staphylococcus aureus]
MMTITEKGHQQFKMLVGNTRFKNHVKHNQYEIFNSLLATSFFALTEEHRTMISRVIMLKDKYYLYVSGGVIHVFTKDFKAVISFNMKRPNQKFKKYFSDSWMLEIDNLNSLERGHGKVLLNEILKIASLIKVEVSLWTETNSNTRYFEKYGFESIGKLGRNKENLMIKKVS